MSAAIPQLRTSDLDAIWARSEPDLELEDGRIRVLSEEPRPSRGSALATAAPVVIGSLAAIARWD